MSLAQHCGNNPQVKISSFPSHPLTPSLATTVMENFCRGGLGSKALLKVVLKSFAVALFLLIVLTLGLPAEAKVTRSLQGNSADVNPPLTGPAHDFGGGGPDVDPAIQW